MDCAYCKLKSTNKWKIIYISEIQSGDILINDISEIVCPHEECSASGWFKKKGIREMHFAFAHDKDCPVVKDSGHEHKTHFVSTGEEIDEDKILYKNTVKLPKVDKPDPPALGKGDIDENGEEETDENQIVDTSGEDSDEDLQDIDYGTTSDPSPKTQKDDVDMIAKYGKKHIGTPVGLYRTILKNGIYEQLMPDGRNGDDILLDKHHLDVIRKENISFDNQKKLAITIRSGTKILKHPFSIPSGYSLLRDAYAVDPEYAIYYLVKVTDNGLNEIFKNQLMGEKGKSEETRDKHNSILIYHQWHEYPNDFYKIYLANISTSSYSFVNMLSVKNKKKNR